MNALQKILIHIGIIYHIQIQIIVPSFLLIVLLTISKIFSHIGFLICMKCILNVIDNTTCSEYDKCNFLQHNEFELVLICGLGGDARRSFQKIEYGLHRSLHTGVSCCQKCVHEALTK